MPTLKIKLRRNSLQSLFIFFWIFPSLVKSPVSILMSYIGIYDKREIVFWIIITCVILFFFPCINKRLSIRQIGIYALTTALFFLSIVIYPQSKAMVIDRSFDFLVCKFPLLYLGLWMGKSDIDFGNLNKWSKVIIGFMIIVLLIGGTNTSEEMDKAYRLLPSLLIITYSSLKFGKFIDIIFMVLGGLFLLISATRGPIILFAIFILLMVLFLKKKNIILVSTIVSVVLFLCIPGVSSSIFDSISNSFSKMGYSTRIFQYLQNYTSLIDPNGRDYVKNAVVQYTKDSPMWGNGLYSDRKATAMYLPTSWTLNGAYAHNIFYEIWCDFGYVLGSFILLLILLEIVRALLTTNFEKRALLVVLLISYFVMLFLSSSYLEAPGFFLTLGFCISINRQFIQDSKFIIKLKR